MKLPEPKATLSILITLGVLVAFVAANFRLNKIREAESHFQKALIYNQDGRLMYASFEMEEAMRLSPDNAYYPAEKGLILLRIAEKAEGGHLLAKFNTDKLQISQIGMKYINDSMRFYQIALSLNPHDASFHHNLGWLFWFKGDKQTAIACMKRAVDSWRKDAAYFVSLGLMLDKNGDSKGANEAYQSALELSPRLLDSRLYADLRKSDPGKSDSILQKAIAGLEEEKRLRPNPIILARLGKIYLGKNREAASANLNESLEQLPNMSIAWFNLGLFYESNNNFDDAIKCFEKSAFLEAFESQVFAKLGDSYNELGRTKEAMAQYEKAISTDLLERSEHSKMALNLYHSQYAESNDLVPKGLIFYCRPLFDVASNSRRLSTFYSQTGNKRRAQYFDSLGELLESDPALNDR
jgi:tetratricopeptide (TPR) repeat protein